jgi:hypothetical protein
MKRLLHYLFRLAFGLVLIAIALNSIFRINVVESSVRKYTDKLQDDVFKHIKTDIRIIAEYSVYAAFFQQFLFIFTGFLTIFGFPLARFVMFWAVFFELALVNNIWYQFGEKMVIHAATFVALFGGVINTA